MEYPRSSSFGPRPVPSRTTSDGAPSNDPSNAVEGDMYRPGSEGNGSGSTSSSKLLHDLLREKRAQARRASKTAATNAQDRNDKGTANRGHVGERLVQSSPIGGPQHGWREGSEGSRTSSGSAQERAGARGMGAREINDHISTLHKQNFDLKLELYHRRQRMMVMEEQIEEIENLKSTNSELQEVNEQLLQELEKRDRAVEEAIGIICELEEKAERLETGSFDIVPSASEPGRMCTADTPNKGVPPSSPPPRTDHPQPATPNLDARPKMLKMSSSRLIELATPQSTRGRTPSFLRSEKGSFNALRSVYLASESGSKNYSSTSLPRRDIDTVRESTLTETPDRFADGLDSPRLSVLSESSFLTVYGKMKRLDLEDYDGDHASELEQSPTRSANVEKTRRGNQSTTDKVQRWIDDGGKEVSEPGTSDTAQESEGTATAPQTERSTSTRYHVVRNTPVDLRSDDRTGQQSLLDSASAVRSPVAKHLSSSMKEIRPLNEHSRQDSSIKGALYTPLSGSHQRPNTIRRSPRRIRSAHFINSRAEKEDDRGGFSFMQGPIFEDGYLPPTPDTLSTVDLQRLNLMSSNPSEASLLDGTPAPARTLSALVPQDISDSGSPPGSHWYIERSESPNVLNDISKSDGESNSARAVKSDTESDGARPRESEMPSFAAPSPAATRTPKSRYPHATQQSSGGDMMFNGEGIEDFASSTGRTSDRHPRSRLSRMEMAPTSPPYLHTPSTDTETQSRFDERTRSSARGPPDNVSKRRDALDISSSSTAADPRLMVSPSPLSNENHPLETPSPSKRASFKSRFLGHRNTSQRSVSSQSKRESDQKPPWGFSGPQDQPASRARSALSTPLKASQQKENHDITGNPSSQRASRPVSRPASSGGPSRPSSFLDQQLRGSDASSPSVGKQPGSRRWGLGRSSSVTGRKSGLA